MSARERLAWITTGSTLIIWGYYFVAFWLDVALLRLDGGQVLTRFIVCSVIALVVMIGLAFRAGVLSPQNVDREPDEMERQIEGRADRIGFRVLEWLIPVALIPCLLLSSKIAAAYPADPAGSTGVVFANAILTVIVLTEIVRELVHIASFRMTA